LYVWPEHRRYVYFVRATRKQLLVRTLLVPDVPLEQTWRRQLLSWLRTHGEAS